MPSGEDCQGRADGVDSDEEGGLRVDDDIYIPPPPRALGELDASRPRLVIAKIVNVNFKSYAGTQVVGPFHKCFSAIVGPNGSGKSNVIDSMLFVFGYRATKIRSKKISVLIHNSSEHPNVSSCSVSVHFQRIIDKPGADYEVVPDSEFVISRTAFKDNSSYYELNRKRVQFKDIARLLRSHGVDLDHNRFLILQGEVEQIAMMKPKGQNDGDTGMLEFLEDIIGTGRYKEPLEKLFEKVELLSERRLEKLNRLRIVEKEKASLEQPMQEVLQYLKLENAAIRLEHQYHQFQRFNVTKESEAQAEKVAEAEADLGKLVDEMKLVQAEKAEAAKRMKERSEHWDGLQKEKDQATARFDKVKRQDEALHAELVETNKRRKANQQTLKAERSKVEELQRVPEKNAKDIKECEDLAEKLTLDREKEEASLAKTMAGLKEKTEPLLEKRSKLEQKLISLRKNVDQAQATFDLASSELQLYQSLEEKETRKLEDLRKLLKDTEDTLKLRNSQLDSLDKKIPATKTSLQKAQEELRQLKDQEAKATAELKGMRVKFEEKRSAMQANTSRNRILEALMKEKREGRIPGIFGRLGDLGAIDSKYDVAISTACGPLDNIVVDTVSTAQACIGYLRANDIGRATFIPLEKQQRFLARCTQKLDTPEEVPRLFDLVKVDDPRVLPAFYYGLQDTLVADDLEQATRIGYGPRRFRVVTLKGELIELSGTMSGGGRTVLRGRMGQRVKDDRIGVKDIEQLQAELDGVYQRCTELRMRFNPLEEQIWTLETALKDMTVDREKYCIQTRTLREQEPSIRKQVETQEVVARNAVSDPEKVERLNEAVEAAKEKLEEAQEDSRATEEQVKRINKEIDNITGDRVKSQQKKIAALTSQIDKSRAEACRLQVAIKTSERNLKKAEKHIETLEADVKACEDRLREMQTQKQKLEDDARAILDELTLVTEALQERDEAISGLREEVSNLQARENRMKSVRIDLDERLKSYRSSLKDLQNTIPALTSKIKSLKLQEVPGEVQEDLQELSEEELSELNEKALQANLQKARRRLPSELPNMRILAEYREKDAAYLARAADLEATTADRDRVREVYETARRRRVQEFLAGFHQITDKLKEMYQMITLGGDAELELVDSLDPFSEGILFSVRPPRKSWKNICNLSGGEKTLSSLALVFALHHYKPTPLYFMDEIDAALDFKNVSIVGNYIKERTKNAQFIVISLRSNMFELADYLVGIYKTFNCTKSVTVDLARYYEKNGIAPPTQITSKSYSSQVLKYSQSQAVKSSQKAANNNNENNESNEDVQSNGDKEGNNRLSLPDLSICPTPEKNPNPKQSAIEEEPQKKKRRLQQQQK